MLIAFTGKMGVGKSTAIKTLTALHDGPAELVKFAQPLYDIQEFIYGRISPVYKRSEGFVKDRPLLQWLGTEWGRGKISESLWIDLWKARAGQHASRSKLYLCDDARFDNEVEAVHALGGKVIQLIGPSRDVDVGIANHASEAGIKPELVDFTIHNTGTVAQFEEQLTKVYGIIKGGQSNG